MKKLLPIVLVSLVLCTSALSGVTINLWHAYRGDEQKAIKVVARAFNLSHRNVEIKLLMVPFGAFSSKLLNTIPLKAGPDVFIYAQDHVGHWVNSRIILPLDFFVKPALRAQYLPNTLKAFNYGYKGALWALPGSFKNICLFYNKDLVRRVPRKVSQLIQMGKRFTDPKDGSFGRWGLVYDMGDFYFHTMWIQGFGGRIFRKVGRLYQPLLDSPPVVKSMYYARKLRKSGIIPPGASGTLMTQLFNRGKAMFVISGQWFRGEIAKNINYGVADLPVIDQNGKRAVPFLTVEGYFMARYCKDQKSAFQVIKYCTGPAMGKYMGIIGKHTPANKGAYKYASVRNDPISKVFRRAADYAVPMPNNPEMSLTWGPATSALNDCLGGANVEQTLKKYQNRLLKSIREMRRKSVKKK